MNIKVTFFRKTDFVLFFLLLLLVSCAPVTDMDILSGTENCRPPCWMNIQPGITKVDDAIRILLEDEKRGEGDLTLLDSGIARWRSDNHNIYIYKSDNGLVSKIELDLRPSQIHLDDIITLFGEPSNVDVGKIRDGFFFATIAYPEKGLAFVGSGDDFAINGAEIDFFIQPEMLVVRSVLFQPSDIATMVNLLYGINTNSEVLLNIQDWSGYGKYREKR